MMRYQQWMQKQLKPLTGKTVIVTGGNSGIGFEAARGFLAIGANVILACRNESRATAAKTRLLTEYKNANVTYIPLDLADTQTIDAFVEKIGKRYQKIDIVLHCAGVYYPRISKTAQGYPATVGINFFGTAYLTELILPLMNDTGRMIFTTSLVDRFGKDKTRGNGAKKEGYAAYAQSKYLLSALSLRLATKRTKGQPSFIAVHPGITATALLSPEKTTHKPLFSRLGHAFLYLFTHSPEKAALTALWAAAGPVENGDMIGPRGLFGISGYPQKTTYCHRVKKRARSPLSIDPEFHLS